MEFGDEYVYAGQALPTPTDTPYRTPRNMSRRSSRYGASSPPPSSSPPPLPPSSGYFQLNPEAMAKEENVSVLDPRRFTPNLHASLVAEILSLRRDLESKNGVIETLESSLQTAKTDYDGLSKTFSSNAKETRSLQRQMQLLEGGTASALGELAKERDEALDLLSEIRRRLETSQKKSRNQEIEAERACDSWEKEKEAWDAEKRGLERRVHVAEGRLNTVLEEVALQQASAEAHEIGQVPDPEDLQRDAGAGPEGDTASVRSLNLKDIRPMSAMSNSSDAHSLRYSTLNGPNGYGGAKFTGLSLAEELNFDEEDEEQLHALEEGDIDPSAPRNNGAISALGTRLRHQRNWSESVVSDTEPSVSTAHAQMLRLTTAPKQEIRVYKIDKKVPYVDVGVQFSPPPSPKKSAPIAEIPKVERADDWPASPLDNEANQRRKRVSVGPIVGWVQNRPSISICPPPMVSASSQTIEIPPSPPRTPKSPPRAPGLPEVLLKGGEMECISMQTDTTNSPSMPERPPPPIPAIAIHPPVSAPKSTDFSSLSMRSVACQTSVQPSVKTRSVCMQTEGIRIDNRPIRLPPHLLPSSISSNPPTPQPPKEQKSAPEPRRKPPKPPKIIFKSNVSVDPPSSPPDFHARVEEAYPGNNDNGPLGDDSGLLVRRPFRISSLFAGFDSSHVGSTEAFDEPPSNDSRHPATLPTFKSSFKLSQDGNANPNAPSPVAELIEPEDLPQTFLLGDGVKPNGVFSVQHISALSNAQPSLSLGNVSQKAPRARQYDKAPRLGATSKAYNIRRAAIISSGAAAHTEPGAKTNPSGNESTVKNTLVNGPTPPFPVPTRSSSRKIPLSRSDGTQSPTPRGTDIPFGHRRKNSSRSPIKRNNIRKVRSAAAMPRGGYTERQRSRSPPPPNISSIAPDSPKLPPMPRDDITSSRYERGSLRPRYIRHPSASTCDTGNGSVSSSMKQVSVVDAIAQTMVGEWMWKYVRRGKPFGAPESPQPNWERSKSGQDSSGKGTRHRRWVWLAPYERTVMWSSKQPVSGSALLGKNGRKLSIISVLDVKDDTPNPKNAGTQPLFNRSILILTPARALKFTASTKERHQIWLSALGFLSQSAQGGGALNDLGSLPPIPPQGLQSTLIGQAPTLRRNPIRDSIRVAKGKPRPTPGRMGTYPSANNGAHDENVKELEQHSAREGSIRDAADPPNVPRFATHAHGRKRSSTGPRIPPPPSTLRNFSHNPSVAPASYRATSSNATSSELNGFSTLSSLGFDDSGPRSLSMQTSEVSGEPSGTLVNNFFDAVGTVRMEAFVARPVSVVLEQDDMAMPRRRPGKKDMSYWGVPESAADTPVADRRGGILVNEEYLGSGDPFGGF
ncbi:MAG: hypothetical protein M1812_004750 [Candelaria pacifica]|nr:MAG: hypothetical protein M1812_004750 [Candelaria pacifica]